MSAGETKDVEAVFPSDYPKEDLAGKTAVFTVTVHDVKALELPAIDDEFAKAISENETLETLRVDVRKRLEAIAQSRARRAIGNTLMEKLVGAHDFPLPDVLVDREVDNMINDLAAQVAQGGATSTNTCRSRARRPTSCARHFAPTPEQRVKGTMVIEEIARAEGINATPADIAEELAALSRQYGQPIDRIRKALGDQRRLADGGHRAKQDARVPRR